MGVIKTSQLTPGVLLRKDVRDRNGRFLVPGGTTLTEKHIRVIKIWGVAEVEVETQKDFEPTSPAAAIDPEQLRQAEAILRDRFRFCDLEHPAVAELFRLGLQRLTLQSEHLAPLPLSPPPSARRRQAEKSANTRGERFQQLADLIRTNLKLTTLPKAFSRINETLLNPNSSSWEVADLLNKDTAISARLLKLVNSSFYDYPSRIDSISQVVSIVGFSQLSVLAFGIDVVAQFNNLSHPGLDMDAFWTHCIACGVIARMMASARNTKNTERFFVAGLLHDVGQLIIYHYKPNFAREILSRASKEEELLHRSEEAYLGGDHSQIGGLLLRAWKLPQSLENAVRFHHAPVEFLNGQEPVIVHCADIAALALGFGSTGERFVPPLDPAAWEQSGFAVNGLEPLLIQADSQIKDIFQLFNS